jgi:hypothetical protein
MANKYMKTCLPSLAIKEIQIKTTLRFHFTLVRMAIIRECGEKEPLYTVGGNVD